MKLRWLVVMVLVSVFGGTQIGIGMERYFGDEPVVWSSDRLTVKLKLKGRATSPVVDKETAHAMRQFAAYLDGIRALPRQIALDGLRATQLWVFDMGTELRNAVAQIKREDERFKNKDFPLPPPPIPPSDIWGLPLDDRPNLPPLPRSKDETKPTFRKAKIPTLPV